MAAAVLEDGQLRAGRRRLGLRGSAARRIAGGLVFGSLVAAALPLGAAASPPPEFWQKCDADEPAGQRCLLPRGVAVDPVSHHLFVADSQNARVIEFTAWGEFKRTWGWGVVASGPGDQPQNELQELDVDATAGQFRLRWGCGLATTGPIPFDASATQVQAALEALPDQFPCVDGTRPNGAVGDFSVTGPAGGPWAIEYTGTNRDLDLSEPSIEASTLTGGAGASVTTTVQGANFEVCIPAAGDTCQAGQRGSSPGQFASPLGLAVDSSGDVYVVDAGIPSNQRVQKFSASGQFELMFGGDVNQGPINPGNICTAADIAAGDVCGAGSLGSGPGQFGNWTPIGSYIAVGPGDQIYVGDENRIQHFDAGGVFQDQIALPGKTVRALTVDPGGDLYVVFSGEVDVHRLSPSGTELAILAAVSPSALATDADGNVYVYNRRRPGGPGGSELPASLDTYSAAGTLLDHFELDRDVSTGIATGPVTADGDLALYLSVEDPEGGGGGFVRAYSPVPEPGLVGLPPAVPPTITDSLAVSVTDTAARLAVEINPHYWPDTTYYLEYGDQGPCSANPCQQLGAPGLDLDAGVVDTPKRASFDLSGLTPKTRYHYRFVAVSGGGGPVVGPDRAFITYPTEILAPQSCANSQFRTGDGASLPDCRAYEMVSPVDKNGADAKAPMSSNFGADATGDITEIGHLQASLDGNAITYASAIPFGDAKAAPLAVQYLSRRGSDGWSTHGLDPASETLLEGDPLKADHGAFDAFSDDLSVAWMASIYDPPPDPAGVPGFENLYRRDNGSDQYTAVTTVTPPTSPGGLVGDFYYHPRFAGFSADGSVVIFTANDRLAPGASNATTAGENVPVRQIYAWREGAPLTLVSRLPNNSASSLSSVVGAGRLSAANAISDDGQRIYWTAGIVDPNALEADGGLYVRDGNTTFPVSGTVSAADAKFRAATADGSAALFTIGSNLYRFDLASHSASLIAAGVGTVGGATDDLSRIYFDSTAVLDPDPNSAGQSAEAGRRNLYYYQAGVGPTFIAIARRGDTETAGFTEDSYPRRLWRVSADGRDLVFVSRNSLTGYDNRDTDTADPAMEVFRYAADTDQLDCVSCNPTGARPQSRTSKVGGELAPLHQGNASFRIASSIPGARNGAFHLQRNISDDGSRVFFDSFDRLLPADRNDRQDVYQWQAPGSGDCTSASPNYFEINGGCLSLISSGHAPGHAEFVDATPTGSTVFFRTDAQLVGQDQDSLLDIYAARSGGGFAAPPTAPEPCQGEACPAPPEVPDPPSGFSSTDQGAENPPVAADCRLLADKLKATRSLAKRLSKEAKRLRAHDHQQRANKLQRKARQARKRAKGLEGKLAACQAQTTPREVSP